MYAYISLFSKTKEIYGIGRDSKSIVICLNRSIFMFFFSLDIINVFIYIVRLMQLGVDNTFFEEC